MGWAFGLLALAQVVGCKSPEDLGFDAAAQFTAPMTAIGLDTVSSPCEERIAIFEDLVQKDEYRQKRLEVGEKVGDAIGKDGFDDGFNKLSDVSENVFEAFEKKCPEQTPKARELALGMAKELQIESKVAWLTEPPT
ncbi:MAG: hypothetical protein ACE37F_03250 [Nannocystaceae bacterium]|nr:hypothetical protein [bacterium]